MAINEKSKGLLGLEIQLLDAIKLNCLFEKTAEKELKKLIRLCNKSQSYDPG
jgi:hypothetical protein